MELIYILSLECFFSFVAFHYGGFYAGIAFSLLSGLFCALGLKKNRILLFFAPVLFCLRLLTLVSDASYAVGERISVLADLADGRGRIEKMHGKVPLRKSYCKVAYIRDGRYDITGSVTKIERFADTLTYTIAKEEAALRPPNPVARYFIRKAESLTENTTLAFRNLFMAVVLGDAGRLDRDTRALFSYTGTSHLLALSGLHIGLVFTFMLFAASKLPIMRNKRYLLVLAAITVYFAGVKNSPSLSRAWTMVVITTLGKLLYENVDTEKSLAASLLLGMFINPPVLREVSLKLSYLAVAAIVSFYPLVKKTARIGKAKWLNFVCLTLTIQFFLTPILIREFEAIPFLAFLTNLVMLPVGSVFISLAFGCLLLSNFGLGQLLIPLAEPAYAIFMWLLQRFHRLPWLTLNAPFQMPDFALWGFYGALFAFIFYRKYKEENIRFRGEGLVVKDGKGGPS
ncbi:MAG: ComEC/Rec2 family competence protein [Fusobacteriaceae bacterium]|jgi:competence protein ComEC|nr:ComEC/Rec2 family competence protein [Fusobacteriaceae bacterium]